jgi:hypothetical protein
LKNGLRRLSKGKNATGGMAWFGDQMQEGMGTKVVERSEAGGVLSQRVELLPGTRAFRVGMSR